MNRRNFLSRLAAIPVALFGFTKATSGLMVREGVVAASEMPDRRSEYTGECLVTAAEWWWSDGVYSCTVEVPWVARGRSAREIFGHFPSLPVPGEVQLNPDSTPYSRDGSMWSTVSATLVPFGVSKVKLVGREWTAVWQ